MQNIALLPPSVFLVYTFSVFMFCNARATMFSFCEFIRQLTPRVDRVFSRTRYFRMDFFFDLDFDHQYSFLFKGVQVYKGSLGLRGFACKTNLRVSVMNHPIYLWNSELGMRIPEIRNCQLDLLKFLLVSELKYRLEGDVLDDAVDWNPSSVF